MDRYLSADAAAAFAAKCPRIVTRNTQDATAPG